MYRFPRLIRLSAVIALLAAIGVTAAPWHTGDDDLSCAEFLVARSAGGQAGVAAARPATQPQHCLLCHWNRWVRSIPTERSVLVAPTQDASRLIVSSFVGVARAEHGLTPGRAPPA